MHIAPDMNLDMLIPLMGERYGIAYKPETRFASRQEAEGLRTLLVRDFTGNDTNNIPGSHWNLMCCAVAPAEQAE